jgi:hypothetical protein
MEPQPTPPEPLHTTGGARVLVAEYQTRLPARLPDKKLLQAKLHEFYALTAKVAK